MTRMLSHTEIERLLVEAARRGPSRSKRARREVSEHVRDGRDPSRCVPVTGHVSGKDILRSWRSR